MSEREEKADGDGKLSHRDQVAGDVVDSDDVIHVYEMARARE